MASDFFEKSKQGFKRGLIFFIVDIIMLIVFFVAITMYWNMSKEVGGMYTVLLFMVVLMVFIYTIMHFYLYEMEITFEDSLFGIYKNSFLLAFATMPVCFLLGAIIWTLSFTILNFFTPVAIVIITFLCWISLMRFIIDFCTTTVIKNNILEKHNKA